MRPRMSRIFWRGKLPRLPAQGHRRHQEARPDRARALRADATCGPRSSPRAARTNLEQWVSNRFGKRLYTPLLQGLHREGVGRPRHRGPRRVGRPAHQGPELLQRRQGRVLRQQGQQDQVADRQVPVPPLRPGPDVGDDDRPHRGARRRGAARDAGHALEFADGECVAVHTPDEIIEPRGRHLVAAAARDRRHRRPGAARARSSRPPRACATATSSPSRSCSTARTSSPTTGSTSTSRTSSVGRIQNYRSWSPWMVPDPDTACVGLEYFAFKGDELWTMDDDDLVALATRELEQLGLAPARAGAPRLRRARPARLPDVRRGLRRARRDDPRVAGPAGHELPAGRPQRAAPLQQLRPLDAERDARGGQRPHGAGHDIWAVNVECAYHEEQTDARPEQPYRTCPVTAVDAARRWRPSAPSRPGAGSRALAAPVGRLGASRWRRSSGGPRASSCPTLPAASVALPRLAPALALYALATAAARRALAAAAALRRRATARAPTPTR